MATETVAPAPPGVQSTFDKPLGPQPSKTGAGDKFRKAFSELTHEDVKPQGQETPPEKPSTETPAPEPPKEPPKEAQVALPSDKKPESPLDAVLAKTPKETPPAEEPDVLKEFDEKTANWQRAREVMKTQSGELKTLREKVQTLEKAPKAEPSVIELLTKERDEFRQKFEKQEENLKAINYQYSQKFQDMIAARDSDVSKLSTRIKAHGGDADAVIAALALPEGKVRTAQIDEALSDVDPKNLVRINSLIDKIEEHDEKIADETKNAAPKWDELVAQRDLQLAEQSQAAIKQLETQYGKVVEDIPSNTVTLREVADDVPDGTQWNQEIRSAIETGLKVLKPGGADFNQSVEIAVKGARYDTLEKRYLSLHSDYSELKTKYNELAGSGPDFKGGGKPPEAKKVGPKGAKGYHETLAAVKAGQVGEF